MILHILVLFIGILLGIIFYALITSSKFCGNIIMEDDLIYLSVNKDDIKRYKNGTIVTLRVIRRNFKGFNA